MANNLSIEQRKWILKKNIGSMKMLRRYLEHDKKAFDTPPPSHLTIYRIKNKFDKTGGT